MQLMSTMGFVQGVNTVAPLTSRREQIVSTPGFDVLFWICAIGLVAMYIYIEKKRM